MIKEITGDLLRDGKGILCHQVNTYGVMGGGIAAAIADRLLTSKQYRCYANLCSQTPPEQLIGTVQYFSVLFGTPRRVVANMFSQNPFSVDGNLTNYDAMKRCLEDIKRQAIVYGGWNVSIPGYIGCGIAGGDWSRVKPIIEEVFGGGPVDATIIYWDQE